MTEVTINITETQLKILTAMLNQVQVRLSEAEDFLDLKRRIDAVKVDTK